MMKLKIEEHEINLPRFKKINIISGIDRYGFSIILAERLGVYWYRRSFANWLHGWIWWGARSPEELMVDNSQKKHNNFIVSKDSEKNVLTSAGFSNVWVGGLPYSYTKKNDWSKVKGSLLAMPHHTTENTSKTTLLKLRKSLIEYFDYLESLKNDFSSIWVSIYSLDSTSELLYELDKRGLFFIEGARPNDANSLQRMRAILDTFEFVTTNTMGSHIIYALFSECKVSIVGPEFILDESDFKNNMNDASNLYYEKIIYYRSREYLKDKFPFIICENPLKGFESKKYAEEEIGFDNLLENNEIYKALRWGWADQLSSYTIGGMQKINRKLNF